MEEGPQVTGSTEKHLTQGREMTESRLGRIIRHVFTRESAAEDYFSVDAFRQIEQAITESEQYHCCEIALVVEASLSPKQIWRRLSSAARAMEMFGRFRIWDTELNNGLLIYVLVADRTVEVLADRALARALGKERLAEMAAKLSAGFKQNRHVETTLELIRELTPELARHFPATKDRSNPNELGNKPIRI